MWKISTIRPKRATCITSSRNPPEVPHSLLMSGLISFLLRPQQPTPSRTFVMSSGFDAA